MSSPRIPNISTTIPEETEPIPEATDKTEIDEVKKEVAFTSSEPVLYNSENEKIKNLIISASEPAYYQHPQPYPYGGNAYSGHVGSTPVYQYRGGGGYDMGNPFPPQNVSRSPTYRRNQPIQSVLDTFDTVEIRNNFVRKVYMILAVQLLITFGFVVIAVFQKDVREYLRRDVIFYPISIVLLLILLIVLTCYQYPRRQFPLNFILLFLLTISMAYFTAVVSCAHHPKVVMIALGTTTVACVSISLLAWQTKFDVTGCGAVLYIATLIIMLYGLIATFVYFFTGLKIVYLIYSCLVTLLFCMYLMYDTQQILGGRSIELSEEEYIFGALQLYIDIIYIFLHVLRLVTECFQ